MYTDYQDKNGSDQAEFMMLQCEGGFASIVAITDEFVACIFSPNKDGQCALPGMVRQRLFQLQHALKDSLQKLDFNKGL